MIKLTKENYKQYLPIDMAAFAFAVPGAMGVEGLMEIFDQKGEYYTIDYLGEGWSDNELEEVNPVLKHCELDIFGRDEAADGWTPINLGMGNHLFIRSYMKDAFISKYTRITDKYDVPRFYVYSVWKDIVQEIIQEKK